MIQKQKTSNLFEVLIKEEFKLQLNEIFMTHYLVFKDEMEFLELAQRDGVGSLVHYV
jgi:hypothetical protein